MSATKKSTKLPDDPKRSWKNEDEAEKKILKSKKHSASWQVPQSTQGLKIDPNLWNRIIGFSDFLCRGILEERSVREINARLRQIRGAIFQELHYSEGFTTPQN